MPNWVGDAQQIDNDAVFKKTEERQTDSSEEDTLVKKCNQTSQTEDLSKKTQSGNWWAPPRDVIIYFSELCESYPEAIDCYVLPLVQTEIRVILIFRKKICI